MGNLINFLSSCSLTQLFCGPQLDAVHPIVSIRRPDSQSTTREMSTQTLNGYVQDTFLTSRDPPTYTEAVSREEGRTANERQSSVCQSTRHLRGGKTRSALLKQTGRFPKGRHQFGRHIGEHPNQTAFK